MAGLVDGGQRWAACQGVSRWLERRQASTHGPCHLRSQQHRRLEHADVFIVAFTFDNPPFTLLAARTHRGLTRTLLPGNDVLKTNKHVLRARRLPINFVEHGVT